MGEGIAGAGTIVSPPVLALLAAQGLARIEVHLKPRVAIIVTGDELCPAGRAPRRGEIRDSNTPALLAALESLGITGVRAFRSTDRAETTVRALRRALDGSDLVITAGGVSVGPGDQVRGALRELGVRTLFWGVAIRPGKPVYAGRRGDAVVIGLPGNPVAALLGFQLFVRPAILRMMGAGAAERESFYARLQCDLEKKPGRLEFIRGTLGRDAAGRPVVRPTRGQGSHMLGGMAAANCLIHAPEGAERLPAGTEVEVSLLRWCAQ